MLNIKDIIDCDFVNYRKPSMFIGTCSCDWKCCLEGGMDISVCQNSKLASARTLRIDDEQIYIRYALNKITEAVVFGGLEPMLQFSEVLGCIQLFRLHGCADDIVIYTGYYPNEITEQLQTLEKFRNIIVKFGRYIPNKPSRYDDILGVTLISDNQYAERIS